MSEQATRYTALETIASKEFNDGRALIANLTEQLISHDRRYVVFNSPKNNLGAGFYQLADFSAQFSFKFANDNRTNDLSISQSTKQQQSDDYSGVSQRKQINASSLIDGYTRLTTKNSESYTISVAHEGHNIVELDQKHSAISDSRACQYISQYDASSELSSISNQPMTLKQQQRYSDIKLERLVGDLDALASEQKSVAKLNEKLSAIDKFMDKLASKNP
ncbi:MAG: hypothetical protein HRU25_10710 [Psychrobium sp.]|nr:hypothetical protein [Psychrobium sp.]